MIRRITIAVEKHQAAIKAIAVAVGDRIANTTRASQNELSLPGDIQNVIVVATGTTINDVARGTKDHITIFATVNHIKACTTCDSVFATFTKNSVVTFTTINHVVKRAI